jgi:hypothetical protein
MRYDRGCKRSTFRAAVDLAKRTQAHAYIMATAYGYFITQKKSDCGLQNYVLVRGDGSHEAVLR